MVWSTFTSYYYQPNGVAWIAWNPEVQHRSSRNADNKELVFIQQAAQKYQTPPEVTLKLDDLITEEIYGCLTQPGELDTELLEEHGFELLKDSTTRVVFHKDYPQYLIKVSTSEKRFLPMESTVKCDVAKRENKIKEAWCPLQNTNLLRAAGKEYFVKKLDNLAEDERKYFDFPEEYIYEVKHALEGAANHQKYFSISEKKNIYTGDETVAFVKDLDEDTQRILARKIIDFVKRTRIHDLHKENLVLSKDIDHWCFEIIDSEPLGILIDSEDTGAHLFDPVEHVLLGLISFRDNYCRAEGLTVMSEEADQAIVDYVNTEHPGLKDRVESNQSFVDATPTTWCQGFRLGVMIVLSIITGGILPIILLVIAGLANCCCRSGNPSIYDRYGSIRKDTPGLVAFSPPSISETHSVASESSSIASSNSDFY